MVLLLTVSITCTQALNLLQRITQVVGLTQLQKTKLL